MSLNWGSTDKIILSTASRDGKDPEGPPSSAPSEYDYYEDDGGGEDIDEGEIMETMESVEDEAANGHGGHGGHLGNHEGGPFATNHRGQLFVDSEGIHRPLQRKNRDG